VVWASLSFESSLSHCRNERAGPLGVTNSKTEVGSSSLRNINLQKKLMDKWNSLIYSAHTFIARRFVIFYVYSATGMSYLADILSLRLAGAVGARSYVRSSFSQWAFSMTWNKNLSLLSHPAISCCGAVGAGKCMWEAHAYNGKSIWPVSNHRINNSCPSMHCTAHFTTYQHQLRWNVSTEWFFEGRFEAIFCHAVSGRVGRVRSAREKSLEILRRG